ncbi:hypothetical protein BGZ59_005850 [Podila verticillata]|nr:hypothetical protein BGZ59_005850 [Podila verticillata]
MYNIRVHPHNINLPFLDKMPIPRKTYSIYRRYEDILEFAEKLEEEFPWLRTIQVSGHPLSSCLRDKSFSPPWLVLKARSPSFVCNGELECTQRKESLNKYLTDLFSYSAVVTQSRLAAEFFGIWKTDLEFRISHHDKDPLALHSLFTPPQTLPSPSGSFHDSDESNDGREDDEDGEDDDGDESDYSDTGSEYDSGSDESTTNDSLGSESVYERVESVEDFNSLVHPPAAMLGKLRKAASLQNMRVPSPILIPLRASSPRRERIVIVFPEENRKPIDEVEPAVHDIARADPSSVLNQISLQTAFAEGHQLISIAPKLTDLKPATKQSKHSSLTLSDRPHQTGAKQIHRHPYQDPHHTQTTKSLSASSIQTFGPSSSVPSTVRPWLSRVKSQSSEKRSSLYKFLTSSPVKDSVLTIATKASASTATLVPYKKALASPAPVSVSNYRAQYPAFDEADDEVRQWASLMKSTDMTTGERSMKQASSSAQSRPSSPFSRFNFISGSSSSSITALTRPSGTDSATGSPTLSVATVPGSFLSSNFSFTFKIILDEETILALQVIEDDHDFVLSLPDLRLRVAKKLTKSQVDISEAFELVWSAWSGEQVVLKNDEELRRAMQVAQGSRRAPFPPLLASSSSHHPLYARGFHLMNPLELPEILYRLGFFLTPWVRAEDKSYLYCEFRPRALAASIRVNRTWRDTLTPFLWTVFDDTQMNRFYIPQATYDANSRYFRSFKVSSPNTATVPHQATQLRHLDISGWIHTRHASKLIRANPHLTELKWVIMSKTMDQDLLSTHLLTALTASLEKLQILSIEQLQACHTHYFPWVLTGLPSLKHLSIRNCSEIEPCDAASFDEPFPALTVLRLACDWYTNPGLAQLVRFCPDLERLFLNPGADCPVAELAKNLRECCPRLISIECQDPYEAFQVGVMMTSDDYAVLIGATKALAHLEMPIGDLDLEIYQALMEHAPSLETLDLYICGDAAENFSNANRLLAACPRLKYFALRNYLLEWNPEAGLALFANPWNCRNLEAIVLDGFATLFDAEENSEDGDSSQEADDWQDGHEEEERRVEDGESERYVIDDTEEQAPGDDPDYYSDGYYDDNGIEEQLGSENFNTLCDALAQQFTPAADPELQELQAFVAKAGWELDACPTRRMESLTLPHKQALLSAFFKRAATLPRLRTMYLNGFKFIKSSCK